jgi:hypothetical protein
MKLHYDRQHKELSKEDVQKLEKDEGLYLKNGWIPPYPYYTNWQEFTQDYANT